MTMIATMIHLDVTMLDRMRYHSTIIVVDKMIEADKLLYLIVVNVHLLLVIIIISTVLDHAREEVAATIIIIVITPDGRWRNVTMCNNLDYWYKPTHYGLVLANQNLHGIYIV